MTWAKRTTLGNRELRVAVEHRGRLRTLRVEVAREKPWDELSEAEKAARLRERT